MAIDCGGEIFLTLVVLIVTTIALWAWEKNPFAYTLPSAQERYMIPSSEFHADTRNDSAVSLKPMEKIGENSSQLIIRAAAEGEENNFDTVPVDAISAHS